MSMARKKTSGTSRGFDLPETAQVIRIGTGIELSWREKPKCVVHGSELELSARGHESCRKRQIKGIRKLDEVGDGGGYQRFFCLSPWVSVANDSVPTAQPLSIWETTPLTNHPFTIG